MISGWRMFLTVYHKCEREILVKSVLLDSHQDSVLSGILLRYIPYYQGIPIDVVSGALLCCHHAILQPVTRDRSVSKVLFVKEIKIILKPF